MIEIGQIYSVYLDPVFGHEIGGYKTRPVLVVSTVALKRWGGVITVVPGTSTPSDFWNVVKVSNDSANGLNEPTYFQCQQVRAIDAGRTVSRPWGRVSRNDLQRVLETLWETLGWVPESRGSGPVPAR